MTLLLLLRPHRYGGVIPNIKGYGSSSDSQAGGVSASDVLRFSAASSDAAAGAAASSDVGTRSSISSDSTPFGAKASDA